jgi:hypothetical protein
MRFVVAIALAAVVLAGVASSANADFHFTKIREISGETGGSNLSYIELQMYEAGQNLVSGHDIQFWDADGLVLGMPVPVMELTLAGPNPPNSETQRTILIGDTAVAGRDFTLDLTPFMDSSLGSSVAAAGAACFEAIPVDCVSWGGGAFTGAANLPDGATPFGTALPNATALKRSIGANRPNCLDAADDTNSSAADFANVARDPTPNSTTPVEAGCAPPVPPAAAPTPTVTPTKKKKKCKKKKGKKRSASAAKRKRCKKKKKK